MRDCHSHIIWGVDDGASSWEESLSMLDAAASAGVDSILCTPHMRWKDFSYEKVQTRLSELKDPAHERGIELQLGFEVYYDRLLEIGIEHAPEFVEEGTSNLLIEFNSFGSIAFGWERVFYDLQGMYGLDIVVAHPERYTDVLRDFDAAYALADAGCRMQVSAEDLLEGRFGKVARTAKRLLKEGLADTVVSDAHSPSGYAAFAKACKAFKVG